MRIEQLTHHPDCVDRAAEDELMTVAADRDRLAPAAEEARWRARQLERQLADSQAAAETAQAVRNSARV